MLSFLTGKLGLYLSGGLLIALLVVSGFARHYYGELDKVEGERDAIQLEYNGLKAGVDLHIENEKRLAAGAEATEKKLAAARLTISRNEGKWKDETSRLDYACPVPDSGFRLLNEDGGDVTTARHPG